MLRLFVAILMLSVFAQGDDTLFITDGNVVYPGDSRDWDGRYTDPGAAVYHDGQFHLFRNGFNGWPVDAGVGYLTSDDGLTWTEVTEDPVFVSDDVSFARVTALASSMHVEEDGTWVMYFYTWNRRDGRNGRGEIGRATASDPLGPWTIDEEPVLMQGEDGAWDAEHITAPSVVQTEDGYFMYYTGFDEAEVARIGMATSEDGITWEKYEGNPILEAGADWESIHIENPRVLYNEADGWVMIYRALMNPSESDANIKLGLATSEDGITWEKYEGNPVFSPSQVSEGSSMWFNSLLYHEGTYYLYTEISGLGNTTEIHSNYYTGSLPPEN